MNQLYLYNPNHIESTQFHHHPQSHGIHKHTPPPPQKKEKKKKPKLTCDFH